MKLQPGTALRLFGRPAQAFTDQVVPLEHVVEGAAELVEAVLAPTEDKDGFAALSTWLSPRSAPLEVEARRVQRWVTAVYDDPTMLRADQLAEHGGVDLRTLQRLFRKHVGTSPKWLIERVRLQHAARRLEQGHSLSALAAELGYADQAHFSRAFRKVTGRSPRDYVRLYHQTTP